VASSYSKKYVGAMDKAEYNIRTSSKESVLSLSCPKKTISITIAQLSMLCRHTPRYVEVIVGLVLEEA
jgi:hypothetical protein